MAVRTVITKKKKKRIVITAGCSLWKGEKLQRVGVVYRLGQEYALFREVPEPFRIIRSP